MVDEIGYQAQKLAGWSAFVMDEAESNPELQWPQSLDVFDKMRREDSQVSSVLRAVTLPIRSTDWVIDPAGASPEVVDFVASNLGLPVKGRDLVQPLRRKDRFSWREHLRLALLELVYGHSFFEQVYREEDGMLRLRKLAWRPPRTISKIEVASDGGLVAIEQHGIAGKRDTRITVDRLVAYVNEREGGNWVGQSLLRSAYKNWLLKDRMLRAQALTVERNGLGIPDYEQPPIPDSVKGAERDRWLDQQKDAGLEIATKLRAGETAGVSRPNGSKLQLMGVTGKLPDTDAPIRYHDEQIARAVLAHFLNLGTETGSWALGSTFADFFTNSLNAVAEHIADVTQQHVVEDLVDLNFGESVATPVLVCEPIGANHPATAEAVKQLIECGAVKPDAGIDAHMRTRYGLPAATESDDSGGADLEAARDREIAINAANAAQKVYLTTNKAVLNQDEARSLDERAGAVLDGPPPDTVRMPNMEEDEGAEELG